MRKIERFTKYMNAKGLNDNKVTQDCDLSQGLLHQARKGKCDLGDKAIEKILKKYQDLNKVWLLTGDGEMLLNNTSDFQISGEIDDRIYRLITILQETLKEKDKQIDRLLSIIEQGNKII